ASPGDLQPSLAAPKTLDRTADSANLLARISVFLTAPRVAALLMVLSPIALWYAQDAKVYSLLILAIAVEVWALLRALRRGDRRSWWLVLATAFASLFVHRLALLPAVGAALVYTIVWPPRPRFRSARLAFGLLTILLALAGVVGLAAGFSNESRGTGGHLAAGPLEGLWLALTHFSVDRGNIAGFWGLPLLLWMLPALVLALWSLALLVRDARRGSRLALAILSMVGVPLLLLAAALAITPVYEVRYATIAFPAWVLMLAYPFAPPPAAIGRRNRDSRSSVLGSWSSVRQALPFVLGLVLLVDLLVLFQPKHGLFSGAPVKEQWRDAIGELAHQAHPDDLVILHPYFVAPLWNYYAPRVTPDPLPQPVTFPVFAGDFCLQRFAEPADVRACIQREYNEPFFNQQAFGKKRALLLIAPDHARIVDPPLDPTRDRYGFVGLRFQHAIEERAWPCGGSGDQYIGVEIMCMSFPETYNAGGKGSTPEPAVPLEATFGGELHLRGYSLDLLGGAIRPGGTLPVTLYWQAAAPPTRDYTMFLHLCQDCTKPPLAQSDGPPLAGYPPAGRTTTWLIGDPLHDERGLALPADLPPGRYTLLLGVYPAGDPAEAARLPVESAAEVSGGTRLVLAELEVGR
ncbi:MAG TPA: glycosyltransferase family 39 protein, partial [Roseiflexaceae bacterium]|nr:glycosyltransferase family 39 protein [Roseiflexaceae bacterium]